MEKVFVILLLVVSVFSLSAQVDIDNTLELSGADGTRALRNLELPLNGTDAANKDYVDSQSGGFAHYVGELFGGGIVVGVWKESGVEKGLIASLANLSTGTAWSGNTATLIGASAQSLTDGQSNTNAIIAQSGGGNTAGKAATLCDAYTNTDTGTGVFSDWYLPAEYELELCCYAKMIVNLTLPAGAFGATEYWSSTETTATNAWRKYFTGCGIASLSKNTIYSVRAVRRF